MSTYEPIILPGDDVAAAPNGPVENFHVTSTKGDTLYVTSAQGTGYTLSKSVVKRIYRNGLLIWSK